MGSIGTTRERATARNQQRRGDTRTQNAIVSGTRARRAAGVAPTGARVTTPRRRRNG